MLKSWALILAQRCYFVRSVRKSSRIELSSFSEFPPRLEGQPYFYPVLSEGYAVQIARDWNAKNPAIGGGFVTRFEVRTDYLKRFEVRTVGSAIHQEYWIPAEELREFNRNIIGKIEVIAEFKAPPNQ